MSTISTSKIAPAGSWNADPVHSNVSFEIAYAGTNTFRGGFHEYSAGLTDGVLEGSAKVASVAFTVSAEMAEPPVAGVSTASKSRSSSCSKSQRRGLDFWVERCRPLRLDLAWMRKSRNDGNDIGGVCGRHLGKRRASHAALCGSRRKDLPQMP